MERTTIPAGKPLRCGGCTQFIGQAGADLEYETHYPKGRPQRHAALAFVWRCGKCGTLTVFRTPASWRTVEVKSA